MSSLTRRISRKKNRELLELQQAGALTESEYEAIAADEQKKTAELITAKVIAVSCDVICENYGKLRQKNTRKDVFCKLFSEAWAKAAMETAGEEKVKTIFERKGLKLIF